MSTIEKSIDVQVPVHTAYNQWTQFESFPHFMEGVEEVRQISDTRTHWKTRIAGATREFDAEIQARAARRFRPIASQVRRAPRGSGQRRSVVPLARR